MRNAHQSEKSKDELLLRDERKREQSRSCHKSVINVMVRGCQRITRSTVIAKKSGSENTRAAAEQGARVYRASQACQKTDINPEYCVASRRVTM